MSIASCIWIWRVVYLQTLTPFLNPTTTLLQNGGRGFACVTHGVAAWFDPVWLNDFIEIKVVEVASQFFIGFHSRISTLPRCCYSVFVFTVAFILVGQMRSNY